MATYTVETGHKSVTLDLVASQADSVTFVDNVGVVQVVNLTASGNVYGTNNGTTPTVPAAGASSPCVCIPPGGIYDFETRGSTDAIKLISSSTPSVVVQVRDA